MIEMLDSDVSDMNVPYSFAVWVIHLLSAQFTSQVSYSMEETNEGRCFMYVTYILLQEWQNISHSNNNVSKKVKTMEEIKNVKKKGDSTEAVMLVYIKSDFPKL